VAPLAITIKTVWGVMKGLIASVFLGATLACAAQPSARAAAPAAERPVIPLLHTRWLARDGTPRNIESITQTPDGWLWLGTTDGLYRFDGVAFSRYVPPPGVTMPSSIYKIGILPDGTLWVTPFFGGLYLIKGKDVRVFGTDAGFAGGSVNKVATGPDGRLWLAKQSGVYVLDKTASRWRLVNQEQGMSEGGTDVLVDRLGTVWAQTLSGNYAMPRGETRFKLVAAQASEGTLEQGPDGVVWAVDGSKPGLLRLTPGATPRTLEQAHASMVSTGGFYIDGYGGFWFPGETGVVRITMNGERAEVHEFTPRQGLSGKMPIGAFHDREGNIWISTEGGLDQFRPSRMAELALPPKISDARPLVAGNAGELWIAYSYLRDLDATPQDYGAAREAENSVHQIYRDPHGTVMFGTYSRLWKLDGLKRVRVPLPPEVEALPAQTIFAIARDADDALWISAGRRGSWRLRDGVWLRHGGIEALKDYPTTTIVAGPGRRLWFGSMENSLAVLHDGKVRKFGPADGLDIGTIQTILPDATGAWIAGAEGLARFDGGRFIRVQGEDDEQFRASTGLVPWTDGGLWLNTGRGLAYVAGAELRKALADPAHRVRHRRYDESDGLRGAPAVLYPSPSVVRTSDGRLAISTTGGVFHFDPARAAGNRVAPTVQVTGIAAGATAYPMADAVSLPAAPENVRIDYTALSLSVPHRVRFQYQLEGVDGGWQDAGARRAAFYTQLAPGHYTFRVKAANDDGLWNEEGARLRFEIPPTPFQTLWFKLACALALLLLAYGLHRLRLRMALRRLSRTFEARVAERERIARDLHDTLLQSVQGLILHFRRIALRTPDDAPSRPLMQEALALATEVLEEGRDKVGGLRAEGEESDPAALLDVHGKRLAAQHPAAFSLTTEGRARRLRVPVLDEVLAIGREAVRNAFLHAQAGNIEVTLRYGEREFELSVNDDGVGIDAAGHGGRAGHWGIPGMRERAAELGATIDLRSAPGQGCAWRLRLPARLAYADHAGEAPAAGQPRHEGEMQ
jgi:signal transduction histidine kinase/ligand-binding sensor domain-containing protein